MEVERRERGAARQAFEVERLVERRDHAFDRAQHGRRVVAAGPGLHTLMMQAGRSLGLTALAIFTARHLSIRDHAQEPAPTQSAWYGEVMVTRAVLDANPRTASAFNGVKVFSATMFAQRER